MTPLPKRRHSTARAGRRHQGQVTNQNVTLVVCPSCGKSKKPHYVCPSCGKE